MGNQGLFYTPPCINVVLTIFTSDLYLVETALQHKESHTGQEIPVIPTNHKYPYWEPEPVSLLTHHAPTFLRSKFRRMHTKKLLLCTTSRKMT